MVLLRYIMLGHYFLALALQEIAVMSFLAVGRLQLLGCGRPTHPAGKQAVGRNAASWDLFPRALAWQQILLSPTFQCMMWGPRVGYAKWLERRWAAGEHLEQHEPAAVPAAPPIAMP